jgi:hypothetical protein
MRVYAASRSQTNLNMQDCRERAGCGSYRHCRSGQKRNNDSETLAFDLDFTLDLPIAEARMLLCLSLG